MKGLSKIIGGFLGFLLAGPGGCLLGILIGHIFDKNLAPATPASPYTNNTSKSYDKPEENPTPPVVNAELMKAYQVLGVENNATPVEVKQAYRRSISRYHPDRLAQKRLSSSQLLKANQTAQHIKEAYEMICRIGNFS